MVPDLFQHPVFRVSENHFFHGFADAAQGVFAVAEHADDTIYRALTAPGPFVYPVQRPESGRIRIHQRDFGLVGKIVFHPSPDIDQFPDRQRFTLVPQLFSPGGGGDQVELDGADSQFFRQADDRFEMPLFTGGIGGGQIAVGGGPALA